MPTRPRMTRSVRDDAGGETESRKDRAIIKVDKGLGRREVRQN